MSMDIPETVSVRKFRDFSARQKQELYETLLELAESIEELPKKSLRKTLEVTLAVLEYKGEQVQRLQEQSSAGGGGGGTAGATSDRRLQDENEKLKRMLQKLEDERDGLKSKSKELGEEIRKLELRLREAAQQAEASDKDSSDPLSELDKQEQLLQNIDAKNKHIKRLLKEIDTLQNQNIVQSKTIVVHERELENIQANLVQLSQNITKVEEERKCLKQKEQQQALEISRLEGNVTFLEVEREKQEVEMRQFLDKYESKSLSWRQELEERDRELERLKKQLEGKSTNSVLTTSSSSRHSQQLEEEHTKMRHLLESREQRIEKLESKLHAMAQEMVNSTKVMNQLSMERERDQDPEQPRACCQMIEERLRVASVRNQQLSEMLEAAEQDNVLKSKQALHALTALEAYKRGEDGLVPALRRCSGLEQKLAERDKQLRTYIQELNAQHEVVQENELLRRRLHIPDDVVVLAKNARSKQRSKDKQIERLTLKLRTSEELRLQLKLDKSELRRKLLELQKEQPQQLDESLLLQQPSEVGEVPASVPLENSPRRGQGDGAASSEMQNRYEEVLAENETLRSGMYEILEKLREYDATSEHITIDSELLRRLIEALPSGAATPQQLQGQLLELKAREEALRQLLQQQNYSDSETGELSSVQSLCDVPEMPEEPAEPEVDPHINTATRPTSPTEANDGLQRPVIPDAYTEPRSEEQAELAILRKHYEELRLHMSADGSELMTRNQQLHDQLVSLELQVAKQSSSYCYMRTDYDMLLSETRKQELRSIEDKASLSRQVELLKSELSATRNQLDGVLRRHLYTAEEQQQLEQKNAILSMQLGQAMEQMMGELRLPEICAEYGIIKDNHQLDYITAEDFEKQQQELGSWRAKQAELQRETKQLEGLLQVANGQIHSQQRLLNEITDNHINLRHLVADLQSSSNEKLMLAKVQRDLDSVKTECSRLETEREQLQLKADSLEAQLMVSELSLKQAQQDFQQERSNSDIKHKFLKHSLFALKDKYAKFTPLVFLTNFVFAYQKFQRRLEEEQVQQQQKTDHTALIEELAEAVQAKIAPNEESSQQLVKLIKSETQTKLLEQRCEILQSKQQELQRELGELRLRQATDMEHWQTIQALFGEGVAPSQPKRDAETNTEPATPIPAMRRAAQLIDKQSSPIGSPLRRHPHLDTSTQVDSVKLSETAVQTNGILSQQNQAVQTAEAAEVSEKDSHKELQQMQATLHEANQRIEVLCKQLEASRTETRESESPHSGVVEKTILSFHTLLLEKDQSIQKYQDLLQAERDQSQQAISKQAAENESLRTTVNNLNFNIKTKDAEIEDLKGKLEKKLRAPAERSTPTDASSGSETSIHELTDEKIEELFESSSAERVPEEVEVNVGPEEPAHEEPEGEEEKQDTEELKELPTLHKQIKDLKDKLEYSEKNLTTREEEVEILKEKLKLCQEREKSVESNAPPELDQLRVFLDEKDKHIKDLMDTLKNFHDDQQRYINDTSNFSEEQIAKLAADLNRTEATNKIYHTQMEALRRQLANVTQREKQARDLSQSLRQQLLKRPVVSIKTELNARTKNENQQKRIHQLEADLDEARGQLQRQQRLLEAKRTKSANEVGLWEKQKRWQQQAEKNKARLEETEMALEKTRSLLQAARTTIARLEKDKQILESKLGRNGGSNNGSNNALKCCRTPSCPNLQHVGVAKFTPSPSESPETYTGASSECSSPAHHPQSSDTHFYDQSHADLIEALKSRIELQQRKIIAMELEGRGSNALTTELEKLQERSQAIEAQNIRLEARNLQLQLDSDLLKQGDSSDRLQKRIKHLEDYILALKEEMARNESRRELCKCSGLKVNTNHGQSAEHTILSLRNLVEKLRSENKFLKDGRRSTESRSSADSTPADAARLQQQNAEALEKINALEQELQKRTKCDQCGGRSKDAANEELKYIKEQLVKKTQLLQKAKVLLTRAAAKEKVLREQLALWKRKCSELQNVPVIDEISE